MSLMRHMTDLKTSAGFGFILLAVSSLAGQARAQNVTLSKSTPTQMASGIIGSSGTTYQFDGMTFAFTCGSACGMLAVLGVADRAGIGIEIVGAPSAAISSGAAGGSNYGINLGVAVGPSTGISSVTNIVSGSLAVPADAAHDATFVSSDMLSFSTTTSSATSDLSTPSTVVNFANTTSSFSFSDELRNNISGATPGDTLSLNNVTFIFQPAPEPASVALLATGVMGLAATRRRFFRRGKR
jgi:hypothetical protein